VVISNRPESREIATARELGERGVLRRGGAYVYVYDRHLVADLRQNGFRFWCV